MAANTENCLGIPLYFPHFWSVKEPTGAKNASVEHKNTAVAQNLREER